MSDARKCQRCGSLNVAYNAKWCAECGEVVRKGQKKSGKRNPLSSGRLYSANNAAWPRGYGLYKADWRCLAQDYPDMVGARLRDARGRMYTLTDAGPVAEGGQHGR